VPATDPALRLGRVTVRRDDVVLLRDADWTVATGQRWVVLGPNGSGKTTLLRVAGLYLHPTSGTVDVLGQRLGRTDVRRLRARIGYVSAALADMLRPGVPAVDVVMAGRDAALETWWQPYDDHDRAHALDLLDRLGVAEVADRPFGTLSSGERQRTLLARSLWGTTGLVLLDEPMAGLDLGAREDLVGRLAHLADRPDTPATVLVTHHVEDVPPGFTHALLLRDGRIASAGPLLDVLDEDSLSDLFGIPLKLEHRDGRFTARARGT
jgi:iron complex transport system ATP-binding protein